MKSSVGRTYDLATDLESKLVRRPVYNASLALWWSISGSRRLSMSQNALKPFLPGAPPWTPDAQVRRGPPYTFPPQRLRVSRSRRLCPSAGRWHITCKFHPLSLHTHGKLTAFFHKNNNVLFTHASISFHFTKKIQHCYFIKLLNCLFGLCWLSLELQCSL